MTQERANRFNEFIKKELGKIIFDFLEVEPNVLVTVTRVITSNSLFLADAYISVYPTEKSKEIFFKINKSIYQIQQILNKKFKVRPVPKIRFIYDKNPEEASEIEKLLEKTKHEVQK